MNQGNELAKQNLQTVYIELCNDQTIPDRDYCLGLFCEHGWLFARNLREAIISYTQASCQNHEKAIKRGRNLATEFGVNSDAEIQNQLGMLFENGTTPNYEEAIKWYQWSAEKDFCWANGNLGRHYFTGTIPRDKAIKRLVLAANQGVDTAQESLKNIYDSLYKKDLLTAEDHYCLGTIYENGCGIDPDLDQAIKHYEAIVRVSKMQVGFDDCLTQNSQYALGTVYAKKGETEQAIEWYKKSHRTAQYYKGGYWGIIDSNDTKASNKSLQCKTQNALIDIYEETPEFDWGQQGVLDLCHSAANSGNHLAQYRLGTLYETGAGVKQNIFEAIKWFGPASDQGKLLGTAYETVAGVKQNILNAIKWFGLASDQGNEKAKNKLKEIFEKINQGMGSKEDRRCSLGLFYQNGWEVAPQDFNKSIYCYNEAIKKGHAESKTLIQTVANGDMRALTFELVQSIFQKAQSYPRLVCQHFRSIANNSIKSFVLKKNVVAGNPISLTLSNLTNLQEINIRDHFLNRELVRSLRKIQLNDCHIKIKLYADEQKKCDLIKRLIKRGGVFGSLEIDESYADSYSQRNLYKDYNAGDQYDDTADSYEQYMNNSYLHREISEILKYDTILYSLTLSNISIRDPCLLNIAEALKENATLTSFGVNRPNIKYLNDFYKLHAAMNFAIACEKHLEYNKTLKNLELLFRNTEDFGAIADLISKLELAIKKDQSLEEEIQYKIDKYKDKIKSLRRFVKNNPSLVRKFEIAIKKLESRGVQVTSNTQCIR